MVHIAHMTIRCLHSRGKVRRDVPFSRLRPVSLIIVDDRAPPVCPSRGSSFSYFAAIAPADWEDSALSASHDAGSFYRVTVASQKETGRLSPPNRSYAFFFFFFKGRLVCHRNQWRLLIQSRHDHAPNCISV